MTTVWDRYGDNGNWRLNSAGTDLAIEIAERTVVIFRGDHGWGWRIGAGAADPDAWSLADNLASLDHARLEAWGALRRFLPEDEPDGLADLYIRLAFSGAKPDDPRLAVLADVMTNEELGQAKERIGLELLRGQPVPPKAN
jgi:hypothetical protein